jgi:hypothetical protein
LVQRCRREAAAGGGDAMGCRRPGRWGRGLALPFGHGALKEVFCDVVSAPELGGVSVPRGQSAEGRGEPGSRVDLERRFLHSARAGVYLRRCCSRRWVTRACSAGWLCPAGSTRGAESALAPRPGCWRSHCLPAFVTSLQRTSTPPTCGRRPCQRRPRGGVRHHGVGVTLTARSTVG